MEVRRSNLKEINMIEYNIKTENPIVLMTAFEKFKGSHRKCLVGTGYGINTCHRVPRIKDGKVKVKLDHCWETVKGYQILVDGDGRSRLFKFMI